MIPISFVEVLQIVWDYDKLPTPWSGWKENDDQIKRAYRKMNAELTEAEWIIMKVVWENEPCAAGTVQEALANSKAWAYSTVKTTMDRMANKGFLKIQKIRNLQLFSSVICEVDAKRGEFHKMLKRAFDGALIPMMQFLIEHEDLSKAESAQLRKLVNKPKKKELSANKINRMSLSRAVCIIGHILQNES